METYMKKKNKTRSVTGLLFGFMERVSGDHVGAYATQAAYFLIMSFIPCILFLTTLVRYTPLTYNVVRDAIVAFIPENLQSFVLGIVVDVYKRSTAIVPLSAIVALWSAGKGMQSIINGLNTIYHVKETRNWLLTRIYAVFYTLSLVIAVIVSLLMLVLGNEIQKVVSRYIPFLGRVLGKILGARALLVFGVLFLVFLMLYKVLPNRKATFKSQIPGALIIAVAWSIFSYGFSFYFEIFPGFSNMYGNLATIIMVMFALLIIRGYWIALHARDRFGSLLAVGVTTQIALQVFLNIAVVTNLIPNTGISLPFFSYGGTALAVQLAEVGIVLSVSRQMR
mgnify:CR=1 FL=1